jgi:RNA polymerase sigma factor (sigma-70 family)
MSNPFAEKISDDDELTLIEESVQGNRVALEKLVLRHQAWIYNIAFKMVMDHDDASDVTQEILVKMITGLSTYDSGKAMFRTWLYRIAVNHILNMKKKKFEIRINDFDRYVPLIDKLPDNRSFSHPESALLAEELKTGCMMGMVMCLDRRERLVFILGAIFGVTDKVGSELMEVSRDNFRKILSRSRGKVYSHMNGACGHINPENKCRCSNKTKAFFDMGMLDPANTRYYKPDSIKVRDVIAVKFDEFDRNYYGPFIDHFRDQPFYNSPDMVLWLRNMLGCEEFQNLFGVH